MRGEVRRVDEWVGRGWMRMRERVDERGGQEGG